MCVRVRTRSCVCSGAESEFLDKVTAEYSDEWEFRATTISKISITNASDSCEVQR